MKTLREPLSKGRLEAFTDGVIAVIITVLVLELHAPTQPGWVGWRPWLLPALIYAIGFQLTAAMWLLHHNLMVHLRHVNRRVIWANFLFLLFLSLFPVTVQTVSLHPRDTADVAVFCGNAMLCGLTLTLIRLAAMRDHADDDEFQQWSTRRRKLAFVGLGSVVLALVAAYFSTYISLGLVATTFILVLVTG
jgi:uncharacterized membrane protein